MDFGNSISLIIRTGEAGREFAKKGLLYEAAYRYGQAAAMIRLLYAQHADGVIVLDDATQALLAPILQKLDLMAESLSVSAGNGKKAKLGENSAAREHLWNVIGMLLEDIRSMG